MAKPAAPQPLQSSPTFAEAPEEWTERLNPLSHSELVGIIVRLGVAIPAASDMIAESVLNQVSPVKCLHISSVSSCLQLVFSAWLSR